MKEIPQPIQDALNDVAKKYSESPSTTNAGAVLRFFCRFVKPTTIIKMLAHSLSK
ncbi:hypothetical protein OX284_014305 [Flavobacterium sp. SUN046]|uniref:hypothetical protein n=1 Tax=Flavobacterium sp. SUN046 TaxID=3002440 RepID=UPI002DB7E3A4|nr:hypothetical protein [Flavobacterium sp. SUN046]MEC4050608.1 hypothetical protein [Flavobacterium sp. SUN046]